MLSQILERKENGKGKSRVAGWVLDIAGPLMTSVASVKYGSHAVSLSRVLTTAGL